MHKSVCVNYTLFQSSPSTEGLCFIYKLTFYLYTNSLLLIFWNITRSYKIYRWNGFLKLYMISFGYTLLVSCEIDLFRLCILLFQQTILEQWTLYPSLQVNVRLRFTVCIKTMSAQASLPIITIKWPMVKSIVPCQLPIVKFHYALCFY